VAAKKDEPSTKPLLDKLGVKPGMRVTVIDIADDGFMTELAGRAAIVGPNTGKLDMVFMGVEGPDDVGRMRDLRRAIVSNGTVWVVYRKGRKEFNESDVLRLGLETGLVDVKVVRFSDTHTALKFVIRKADR
jgi:hypothetical protein